MNAGIDPSMAARAPWLDTHLLLAVEMSLPVEGTEAIA
jgi:hypothetical protein